MNNFVLPFLDMWCLCVFHFMVTDARRNPMEPPRTRAFGVNKLTFEIDKLIIKNQQKM